MKKILILFFAGLSSLAISQTAEKKSKIIYLSMTSISFTKNHESYFTDYTSDEERRTDGMGVDINTIHGANLFGYVALSAGASIDWNITRTFLSTPLIVDLRVFTRPSSENPIFFYLQTGPNIKWSDGIGANGTNSKGGVGIIFKYDEHVSYYIDIFKKSKAIYLEDIKHNGNYNINGYGLSVGIKF